MTVIKMRKKRKPGPKRKRWYEKHHEACMKLRNEWNVKEGDGLAYFKRLQNGSEAEQELAKTYQKMARIGFWSVDYFDTILAVYAGWDQKLRAMDVKRRRAQIKLAASKPNNRT